MPINPTRPVIAFALLRHCGESMQNDLFGGVAVLIKPLVKDLGGQIYDASVLADRLAGAYGMSLPSSALEDFTSRLINAGILRKEEAGPGLTRAVYVEALSQSEAIEADETLFQGIIDDFVAHATSRLTAINRKIEADELTSGFLRRLCTLDFSSIRAKPIVSSEPGKGTLLGPAAKEARAASEELNDAAAIDALVSSYILALQLKNPDWLKILSEVADGALGLELVLDLQAPTSVPRLTNTTAVIDTPILLSFLDLSSKQQHAAATALIDQLLQSGAKIATYQHSIEEAESVLHAIESARLVGEAYGPTVQRMSSPTYRAFFQTMRNRISWQWQQVHNFEIIQETAVQFYKNFTEQDEEELIGRIRRSIVDRYLTSERDAKSVAETMRRLGGGHIPLGNIASCRFIFVTGNTGLQRRAASYLREKGFVREGEFTPIVTDRYTAGLCWLISGGKAENSPSTAQLLANCAAALRSKKELVARTKQFLAELDETKASHFEALMTNERASQYLVEVTLGNLDVITANNVEDIFAEAQRRAAETVTKERDEFYGEKITELTTQLEAGEILAKELQNKISEIALENAAKELQTSQLENKSAALQAELALQRQTMSRQENELQAIHQSVAELTRVASNAISDNEARKKGAMDFANRYATRRILIMRILGAAVLWSITLALSLVDKFLIPDLAVEQQAKANLLLIAVQSVLGLLGVSLFFDRFVGQPVQKMRDKMYARKLYELGY